VKRASVKESPSWHIFGWNMSVVHYKYTL